MKRGSLTYDFFNDYDLTDEPLGDIDVLEEE